MYVFEPRIALFFVRFAPFNLIRINYCNHRLRAGEELACLTGQLKLTAKRLAHHELQVYLNNYCQKGLYCVHTKFVPLRVQ